MTIKRKKPGRKPRRPEKINRRGCIGGLKEGGSKDPLKNEGHGADRTKRKGPRNEDSVIGKERKT